MFNSLSSVYFTDLVTVGTLQISDLSAGCGEWQQDCLASLLRLLSQFAVLEADADEQGDVFDNNDSPRSVY